MKFDTYQSCLIAKDIKMGGTIPHLTSGRGIIKKGDWQCTQCQYHNFASRNQCAKCQFQKSGNGTVVKQEPQKKEGDWACPNCNENNFASRASCYKCKASKNGSSSSTTESDSQTTIQRREGDWTCSNCNENNFASRSSCYKCKISKNGEGACAICTERPADTCLKMCGHIVMCYNCSTKISECPVCRKAYTSTDVIKTFKVV